MEDFQLLETLIQNNTEDVKESCVHENKKIDKNMYVCLDCGFSEKTSDGQTYTNHKMYKRLEKSNNITAHLEQKGFDTEIILITNKLYNIVVDENTKRTGNKSSIICACVFQAFKILAKPVDYSYIYEKYSIKKKSALKGLKIVNAEIAKQKNLDIRRQVSTPITTEHFIRSYMGELHASEKIMNEVVNIYLKIKTNSELNMSRPQSIAAGIIYYWLKKTGNNEAMKIIEEKSKLSQLTITKKARLVEEKIDTLSE
jgi:transcription initiation factor TFIIIB Brf1 subunit/transcription initiation factor TFIIB